MSSSLEQGTGGYHTYLDSDTLTFLGYQIHQDRLLIKSMGGLFPERSTLGGVSRVLDIGCGPGGWVLDVAATYPAITVVGIDSNPKAIEYARMLSWAENVQGNTSFEMMNPLGQLDFPENDFDLVNVRFIEWNILSKRDAWSALIAECVRITRPGGIIRITEFEAGLSNSLANQKLFGSLTQAFHVAGLTFSPDGRTFGIAPVLKRLLRKGGCRDTQHKVYGIDASYGEEMHEGWVEQLAVLDRLITPFVVATGVATQEERDTWFKQAMVDARSEEYCAMLFFLTAWGTAPERV